MAVDSEIRITPKVDTTDLKKLDQALSQIEQHMQRLVGVAGKIQIPTGAAGTLFPGSGGSGGSGASPAGATAQADTAQAHQAVRERMPKSGRRGSGGSAAASPGQFLTTFEDIVDPILPELNVMMQQPGGKTQTAAHLNRHLGHLQRIAAHPAGSWGESQAILTANQASGVAPGALATGAAEYRATNPSHGAVISAYLHAQKQAQASGVGPPAPSRGAATGVIQKLAGAAGFGEMGSLVGAGLAATGVGAAALGVGYVANNVRQGWTAYRQQGSAFSGLQRSVGTLGESFNTLRNAIDAAGVSVGQTLPQITQGFQAMVPYTGNLGTGGLTRMYGTSQHLAYAYGLSGTATAQMFGQASQLGVLPSGGGTGSMNSRQFATLLANAVSAGGMQGRQGQVFSSLLSVSQQIAQQLGQAPNEKLLTSIMTNLNQSGNPMLQGTMGSQVLSSINAGIQSPGLGSAGALATYQALNPSGQLGYFQTKFLQSQGIGGTNPQTGQSNYAAMLGYFHQMLPHGRVTGTTQHGIWMPSEQSASVAAIMGQDLHLTQSQALNVLRGTQGRSLSQNNATQTLAHQLGPGALNTIIHKGGIGILSQIANAQGVGGRTGLGAIAQQIQHTLHGHVSPAFTQMEHQYTALSHPQSLQQARAAAHERPQLFHQMQVALGHGLVSGPKMQTSMDKLSITMAHTERNWASIARNLTPIRQHLAKLNELLSGGNGGVAHNPFTSRTPLGTIQSHPAYRGYAPTAYTVPGGTPQTQARATLASFVLGNQQSALAAAFMRSGSGSGISPSSPYQNTAWNGPTPSPAGYPIPRGSSSFVRQYLGTARSPSVTRWNAQARADMARLTHRNPHLSLAGIDSILATQSAGMPGATHYNSGPGTTDYGLMQLDSHNFGQWHINAAQALNPRTNLAVGIHFLNQLLNASHGNVGKALESYSGVSRQGAQDAANLQALMQALVHHAQRIEKNTRTTTHLPVSMVGL